jgi:hypothetical protein
MGMGENFIGSIGITNLPIGNTLGVAAISGVNLRSSMWFFALLVVDENQSFHHHYLNHDILFIEPKPNEQNQPCHEQNTNQNSFKSLTLYGL